MTNLPSVQTLYDVMDHTWPTAEISNCGPFMVRNGMGGGSRVSSAVAMGPATQTDIEAAAIAMRNIKQPALFMIREDDVQLDTQLASLGYVIKDPVTLYAAPIQDIATTRPPHKTVFTAWPALAAGREIWAHGGINDSRLAVMSRADVPKTTLLGRADDKPAGTCYVGISQGCAMIHAIEIEASFRRQGLAANITRAAAFWGQEHGARFLTLVTTRANAAANALYASLGMTVVGQYHYRILPE